MTVTPVYESPEAQKALLRFIANVRAMRNAQNRYFKTRDRAWLRESKAQEKKVDDFLKANDPAQAKLF